MSIQTICDVCSKVVVVSNKIVFRMNCTNHDGDYTWNVPDRECYDLCPDCTERTLADIVKMIEERKAEATSL